MSSFFDKFKRDFLKLLVFKIALIVTLVFSYSYVKKKQEPTKERYPIFLNSKKD
ncbi:MAG: hypothetical protein KBD31_04045 [Proteobacteria bacterium]|nr:hypothetical protein [Pseudomonadota bacterium]